ncbi:E3 ubiquitin-protein ligase BIG BROTHER-like isoform X2 [Salvia miltiorrhiza]|uniref:E3 ubiquitin-protein ligase BIG BROTHER-like isoform X2 n=1 Tax=Salvia miltiorrhiza TaxID=226208 RepID=UPI0025AD1ED9|nr:E3 ubiquitin-protein ligase BIG BROTHER-like isoform X2 [Salvia miltiorrhiza]
MDEERRKRTKRTTLDQLEEGRVFPVVVETIESAGDEEGAETSSSSAADEDFEYSDDEFLYGSMNSGIDFWEDDSYSDGGIEEDDVDPDQLSYEELIALGEMVGVENKGLSEDEISKYLRPLTCNSTSTLLIDRCVICQVEYEVGENLVSLQCHHLYHTDCISKWLQINKFVFADLPDL